MLNFPSGFKSTLDLLRFQVQRPEAEPTNFLPPDRVNPPFLPLPPDAGGTIGRPIPTGPSFTGNTFVFNIDGGDDPEETARRVLREFQRLAVVQRGDSSRWTEIH